MANKRLSATVTIGGAVASSLRSAFGTVKDEVGRVGSALRKLEAEQRMLNNAIQTFGRMGKDVDGLRSRYASVTSEIDRQKRALERLKAVEDARQKNLARRDQLRGQIGDTAAIGAAVLLPAASAVKRSADFNYQLQAIGNTADMTRPQVAALGLEILKISDEVGKSAQTVQQAIGYLVAAGMDVGTAAAVLRPIGKTATATASEIEDVAKATFTLNDALKIEPARMQRALDMLVQAGKEGNFEFKDMAAELPVLGAGMQALKMSGTEAVATLGAALQIARKGSGTSQQAATNLENFIAKVLSPETLKKADKLGSDLYGIVSGAQKRGENPFEAAIKEINRITKGGDQKLLGELFQDMQVQNFLRPMLQNLEEYERIKRASLAADGVTARDFGVMMETTKQQMDNFANAAGRAALAVGNALEPAVGRLAATLTPVIRGVTEFVTNNQALVGNSIVVVGALTSIRLATLATAFAFTFVKGGAIALIGTALRLAPAINLVATAVLWLGRALLMNPIGLAVTAIAGAVYLIYKNWEPLKAWFQKLWDDIVATFNKAIQWITDKIDFVGQKWQETKDAVVSAPGKAWGATKEFFGFGDEQSAQKAAPAASALPAPAMATARGQGGAFTDNSQTTIQVTQRPGEDSQALARRIVEEQERRRQVQRRSMMIDGAPAQ